MQGQHGLRLDQPAQREARDQTVEGSHVHAIGRRQLGPIYVTAQNSELIAHQQEFRLWVPESQPDVRDVQRQVKARLNQPKTIEVQRSFRVPNFRRVASIG